MKTKQTKNTGLPDCTPKQEKKLSGIYPAQDKDFGTIYHYAGEDEANCKLAPVIPDGYQAHKNEDTGEILPYCCDWHKDVLKEAERWFELFPNCCDNHKEMAQNSWFRKNNFTFLSKKIVTQLSYTEFIISKEINNNDWLDAIKGYIDYNFLCFGIYGVGLNIYLSNLEKYIKDSKTTITEDKANLIIEHIKYIEKHYKFDYGHSDWLDIMTPQYKEWLEAFPFDLSVFDNNIKSLFSKIQIPIPYDTNKKKFSTNSLRYILNEKQIINELNSLTEDLISNYNTSVLFEQGKLTEAEKTEMEFILKKRKTRLKKGYSDSEDGNQRQYWSMLDKWFEDEIKFLKDIKPHIENMPASQENEFNLGTKKIDGKEIICLVEKPKQETQFDGSQTESAEDSVEEDSQTKKLILETFDGMCPAKGWEYAFRNENDFNIIVDLLTKFFEQDNYELPAEGITNKHGSKTKLGTALGVIHKELGEKLTGDNDFFDIVRTIKDFKNETNDNLHKILTRHRGAL